MGEVNHIVRLRYGKLGAGKYISHLDMIRALERALRRSKLPMDYSLGFTPRPKMSFAIALSVGISSIAEYMDVFLTEHVLAGEALKACVGAFPDSMPLIGAGNFKGGYALAAKITKAKYMIKPYNEPDFAWTEEALRSAVAAFMDSSEVMVEGKDGKKKDIRSLVDGVEISAGALVLTCACGNKNLRVQDFMSGLSAISITNFGESQDITRVALEVDLGSGPADPFSNCEGTVNLEKFRS
jgi:radical SAM-linked protein